MWGDICGYVWGKTDMRIEIAVKNEKEKQTYYGALNYRTGQVITKEYSQGNTENTINFVSQLIKENPKKSSSLFGMGRVIIVVKNGESI